MRITWRERCGSDQYEVAVKHQRGELDPDVYFEAMYQTEH